MSIVLAILLIVVAALGGFAGGLFLSRRQVKQMLMENPPLNEDAVRTMMSSMGRKPSETQVQQVLRQIRAAAKQADTKNKG
ncbi:YneF family protein [Pseudolactococcus carnosus]|uniref:YneF family protein n=1 Tax=Pseudolactococcus carnosus TaxID=2749961 RepID=UPI001FBA1C4C|nr:YneF family protein [Lactococcus carnosus]MCJ1972011.1 YneF family protein [Lactococcus carnosus]